MLKIYAPSKSHRTEYIFQLILTELLGIPFQYTSEKKEIHLNYSTDDVDGAIQCVPHPIMDELSISEQSIEVGHWNHLPCFFQTSDNETLPFDLFAVSFYLVSRYEEYLPFKKDDHRRFSAESSILFKIECLEMPLVNLYAQQLQHTLIQQFPELIFHPRKYEFRSTIDIDQAWKYKHKGFWRNIFGLLRDMSNGAWFLVVERMKVQMGFIPDPYFTFDFQDAIHEQFKTKVNYFFLMGDYDAFDKNINPKKKIFQSLIKKTSQQKNYTVGIHPSYVSNSFPEKIALEKERLEAILGKEVTISRQHYLMHQFPETYQRLFELGITEDHTMGYSTHLGFRAGIAAPFYFFDLSKNMVTLLRLYPFCVMDITPLHYLKLTPLEGIEKVKKLNQTLKSCGGMMISLWHNESLSENDRWKGWRILYEEMLKFAKE